MDVTAIRRENLIRLLERFDTQAAFAKAVGTAPAYISQILSKKTKAGMGHETARQIETALGVPYGYMDVRHDVERMREAMNTVPVVPWDQLKRWREVVADASRSVAVRGGSKDESENPVQRVKATVEIGALTHAYVVVSDAMVGEFPEGSVIIVEPSMQPQSGDYVVALLPNGSGTFRKLVEESGVRYFRPLNPAYPTIPVPAETEIVGVVRESIRRFR